jgi:SET domain-containing protein
VWADGRIVVGRSEIDGRGLFATAPLVAGTVVLRLGGRLVSTGELEELLAAADHPEAPYVDSVTILEDVHLVLPSMTIAHFANHRCDPNLWHVGPYELATRRDVEPGEELTIDYGTEWWEGRGLVPD